MSGGVSSPAFPVFLISGAVRGKGGRGGGFDPGYRHADCLVVGALREAFWDFVWGGDFYLDPPEGAGREG